MKRLVSVLAIVVPIATIMVLASPALAQTTYSDSVQGLEYAAVSGQSGSFLGVASGELPGVMNVMITYTGESPGPNVTETITGGNWTLKGTWGTASGSFTGGTVQWNADTTLANVTTELNVLNGSLNNRLIVPGGIGTFVGVLDHRPLSQGLPPTISGTLQLTFTTSTPPPHKRHHKRHHHHSHHRGGGSVSQQISNG